MLADLDYFKRINDQYGQLVGDEVLKEVARRLMAGVRAYDRVGRYGGEEFLLIMPNCDLVSGFTRADQIRSLISSKTIQAGTVAPNVTVSIGLAVADGASAPEPEKLHQADLGLYVDQHRHRKEACMPPVF